MTIAFRCECGQQLQARDEYAGRKTKCPACGCSVPIPGTSEATPRSSSRPAPRRREEDDLPSYEEDVGEGQLRRRQPIRSGLAVASLILGFLGFCLPMVGGLVALVLGLIGMIKISGSQGRLKGTGMAVTGMILGLVTLMAWPVGGYFAFKKVKGSFTRVVSVNNLTQLGLAMHNYNATNGKLPPAVLHGPTGQAYSWRVALLPLLDQQALYNKYNQNEPWDSPNNKQVLAHMPPVYAVNGTVTGDSTYYQVFTGPQTIFDDSLGGARFADISDGLSNTFLVVEAGTAVPWTQPVDLTYSPSQPLPPLGSQPGQSFPVVMADTGTRIISPTVSEKMLRAAITRNGKEDFITDRDLR